MRSKTKAALPETKRLLKVVQELRTRCPWDKKQTHQSLTPYLIEEAHEVADAILTKKEELLKEELGDVLLQVALHSEIAREKGKFSFEDVARFITDKMIHRHPHIYKQEQVADLKTHMKNWTRLKSAEKPKRHLLEGIPKALPALHLAQRYGEIAASVGFDWASPKEVCHKVEEELGELQAALKQRSKAAIEMELGDLLLTITSLARHLHVDAETALRKSAGKFGQRFTQLEKMKRNKGRQLADCSAEELEAGWRSVKSKKRRSAR